MQHCHWHSVGALWVDRHPLAPEEAFHPGGGGDSDARAVSASSPPPCTESVARIFGRHSQVPTSSPPPCASAETSSPPPCAESAARFCGRHTHMSASYSPLCAESSALMCGRHTCLPLVIHHVRRGTARHAGGIRTCPALSAPPTATRLIARVARWTRFPLPGLPRLPPHPLLTSLPGLLARGQACFARSESLHPYETLV